MSISEIIFEQLGGNKFLAMTGAKNLISLPNGLTFALPKYALFKINRITITLNEKDLYDVNFCNLYGLKRTEIKTVNDVYCEQLKSVISENTGLATSL